MLRVMTVAGRIAPMAPSSGDGLARLIVNAISGNGIRDLLRDTARIAGAINIMPARLNARNAIIDKWLVFPVYAVTDAGDIVIVINFIYGSHSSSAGDGACDSADDSADNGSNGADCRACHCSGNRATNAPEFRALLGVVIRIAIDSMLNFVVWHLFLLYIHQR